MVKVCTKCKIEKPVTEFHKQKNGKDGLKSKCKGCTRSSHRKHYLDNKDKYITKATTRRKNNPAKCAKDKKLWAKNNPSAIQKIRHRFYYNSIYGEDLGPLFSQINGIAKKLKKEEEI